MRYPPGFRVTHHDGGVVIDAHIHADSIVARKLHNRVIGDDREDKDRLAIMNLNDGEGDPPLGKPFVVEIEDQPIPCALNNHFQDDLAVSKRVILNNGVLLIDGPEVHVILAI